MLNKHRWCKDVFFHETAYIVISFTPPNREKPQLSWHRTSSNVFFVTLPQYSSQLVEEGHDKLSGAVGKLQQVVDLINLGAYHAKRIVVQLTSNPTVGTYHTDLIMYPELIYPLFKHLNHEVEIVKVDCDAVLFGKFDNQSILRGCVFENKRSIEVEFDPLLRSLELKCLEHLHKTQGNDERGDQRERRVLRSGCALFENIDKDLRDQILDLHTSSLTNISVISLASSNHHRYFQGYEHEYNNGIFRVPLEGPPAPPCRRSKRFGSPLENNTMAIKERILFEAKAFQLPSSLMETDDDTWESLQYNISLLQHAALNLPSRCTSVNYLKTHLQDFLKFKQHCVDSGTWDSKLFQLDSKLEGLDEAIEEANSASEEGREITEDYITSISQFAKYLAMTTFRFSPDPSSLSAAFNVFDPHHTRTMYLMSLGKQPGLSTASLGQELVSSVDPRSLYHIVTMRNITRSLGLLVKDMELIHRLDAPIGNFKVSLLHSKKELIGEGDVESVCDKWGHAVRTLVEEVIKTL